VGAKGWMVWTSFIGWLQCGQNEVSAGTWRIARRGQRGQNRPEHHLANRPDRTGLDVQTVGPQFLTGYSLASAFSIRK
jgi:hypothetical protein